MKEKFGIFAISKQSSGYGTIYAITDANGAEYTSIYHAEDAMKKTTNLQKINPFSKFFGQSNTRYIILPIYNEPIMTAFGGQQIEPPVQLPYVPLYGVFKINKKSISKLDTSFTMGSGSLGMQNTFSGSLSGSLEFDITNNSSYILTKIQQFNSMSLAHDYVNNIPNSMLEQGQNDFVVLPIYRYNK